MWFGSLSTREFAGGGLSLFQPELKNEHFDLYVWHAAYSI